MSDGKSSDGNVGDGGGAALSGGWSTGSWEDKIVVAAHVYRELDAVLEALRLVGVPDERLVPLYSSELDGPEEAGAARGIGARAAGLVLAGGADVDPEYYGEEVIPWARVAIEPARDEMEFALLEGARESRTPVWGICRGIQVLNVFLGGSLWQDLPTQVANSLMHHVPAPRDVLVHKVRVLPRGRGTALGGILEREPAWVNSRHHQSIKDLAEGLIPVAASADGLLEAAVLEGDEWWVEGVEWHPENLMPMAQQRAMAHRFVDAVSARAPRGRGGGGA